MSGEAALRLLRPRQWLKGFFCIAPVVFAGRAQEPALLLRALLCTVSFIATASAIYVLNDIVDREFDARHPVKQHRPIAAGIIGLGEAWTMFALAALLGFGIAFWLGSSVLMIVGFYLVLSIAYSLRLKRIVVLDVLVVSAGFLLRIFAGAEAVNVPVSTWILLCTFFLALFLGFAKRRAEIAQTSSAGTRAVLAEYDEQALDTFTAICAALALASYALFTTSAGREPTLVITCPPVAFAIFRYLLLCRRGGGESTDSMLVHDRPMQVAIVLWIVLYAWVLYGGLRLNLI
jgi:4-hydroxybenzoate polyprenyltransferase